MSLKVPKANNIQLFKEGYKARAKIVLIVLCNCFNPVTLASTSKDSKMLS